MNDLEEINKYLNFYHNVYSYYSFNIILFLLELILPMVLVFL